MQCGFAVQTAKNGFEAFQKVQKTLSDDHQPFNLVVLDLQMPISDGYDAIKNINQLFDDIKIFKIQ